MHNLVNYDWSFTIIQYLIQLDNYVLFSKCLTIITFLSPLYMVILRKGSVILLIVYVYWCNCHIQKRLYITVCLLAISLNHLLLLKSFTVLACFM